LRSESAARILRSDSHSISANSKGHVNLLGASCVWHLGYRQIYHSTTLCEMIGRVIDQHSFAQPCSVPMQPEFDQPMDREIVRNQINRILQSVSFADKEQLKKLQEVLVRNMDSQAALKPDRVIRELWPDEIKTKLSADVATEMNRLRRTVESYCDEEGKDDPIVIIFPRRSPPGPDGIREKQWIVAEHR
jgi:hypothetical protein